MASSSPGRIQTTTRQALVLAAVIGGALAALVVIAANLLGVLAPLVPWTAPFAVAASAGLVIVIARSTQQRIQVRREWIEPQRAVAFLVLGKAAALAGALVGAGYLTYALIFAPQFSIEGPRERVVRAGVAAVAGAALMVAGLLLERACKVPKDPEDKSEGNGDRQQSRDD